MAVSTLEVDRNIATLRLNSQAFSELSNKELASMFEESIQNIKIGTFDKTIRSCFNLILFSTLTYI